jgi:hypothetical protein
VLAFCDMVVAQLRSTKRLSMPRFLQGHGNVGTAVVWHRGTPHKHLTQWRVFGPGPHAQTVKVLRQKNPYGVVVRFQVMSEQICSDGCGTHEHVPIAGVEGKTIT